MKRAANLLVLMALLLFPIAAQADSIEVYFTNITDNSGVAATVAGQLQLTIFDPAGALAEFGEVIDADQVLFAYTNNVGVASSISEVYIDDGTVVSFERIVNSLGGVGYTLFNPGANPGNLPSGETLTPEFVATLAFSADAVGNPARGVDSAADTLGIVYGVSAGLGGLEAALADGSLRVGMHLRGVGPDEESDSFVNSVAVPEPSLLMLLGLGLSALGFAVRHRE